MNHKHYAVGEKNETLCHRKSNNETRKSQKMQFCFSYWAVTPNAFITAVITVLELALPHLPPLPLGLLPSIVAVDLQTHPRWLNDIISTKSEQSGHVVFWKCHLGCSCVSLLSRFKEMSE